MKARQLSDPLKKPRGAENHKLIKLYGDVHHIDNFCPLDFVQNLLGLQREKMKNINVGLLKRTNLPTFCGTFFLVPQVQNRPTISPSYKRTEADGRQVIGKAYLSFQFR